MTVPDTQTNLTTDRGPIDAAAPGQDIVLIGTGFAPYSTVTVAIYSTPTVLATIATDAHGGFTQTITVPADLPVGLHAFVATGVDTDGEPYAMKLAVTVAPTAGAPAAGPAQLPVTGFAFLQLVATGLALAAAGAGAVIAGRPPDVERRGPRSAPSRPAPLRSGSVGCTSPCGRSATANRS